MNTVVTHHTPDLDAIASAWIIKRFLPNWQDACCAFVPAGSTLRNEPVDSDPQILHVDTGFGTLDHHQTDADTCAAKLAYAYVCKKKDPKNNWQDEALERLAEAVNFYDHFQEAKLADATADYHTFDAVSIIDGLKQMYPQDDQKILDLGFVILDAAYRTMQEKVWSEKIIEKEGIPFATKWGKAIGFSTLNDGVLKLSQKMGYLVAVRKDPKKGYIRIKGAPDSSVDFTQAYEKLKQLDPQATWFLHVSKKMLLNGSTNNPKMKPTSLTLEQIIETLKTK